MQLLGNELAASIREELKQKITALRFSRKPALALLLVGTDPASQTYVGMKKKACESADITSQVYELSKTISQEQLLKKIEALNAAPHIDGILVQLPLPSHIDPMQMVNAIDPKKDVDGFHPINMGKLLLGHDDGFIPCTPLGIKLMLEHYKIELRGKHVVILGRSQIVGKPLGALLVKKGIDATVTIAHSQTQNLLALTQSADILVAAIGSAHFVQKEHVKKGAIVIDVGINRINDSSKPKGYKLVGDVDFDQVEPKCAAITPVPGGVGPLTVASLLKNTFNSYLTNNK